MAEWTCGTLVAHASEDAVQLAHPAFGRTLRVIPLELAWEVAFFTKGDFPR